MKKLYFFFDLEYENVSRAPNLPYRLLLVSVGYVGFHWHSEAEILLVLDGDVTVRDSRGITALSAGDIMIIKPNELHGLVEKTPNLILVVQIDETLLRENLPTSPAADYPVPLNAGLPERAADALRHDLALMAEKSWSREKGQRAMTLSALYHFLGLLEETVPADPSGVPSESGDSAEQSRIKTVLDFLHGNYDRKISLGDVANLINVSPSYASHLIKKGTGRSLQENLGHIRTGRAINLMMKSDRKLLDISMSVGFSDPKYFNRYFHKLFGCSPKEMKKMPDWHNAILSHYRQEGLDPSRGRPFLERYLDRD